MHICVDIVFGIDSVKYCKWWNKNLYVNLLLQFTLLKKTHL